MEAGGAAPSRAAARFLLPALYLFVAGVLSGAGITQHVFWDDEANTAIFARNILNFGTMTAWDGINVLAFRGGVHLDQHLMQATFVPVQHYVAAAGIRLLGETTLGGRLPFLLAGLGTLWMLHRWTAALMGPRFPAWLPPLVLALNVAYLRPRPSNRSAAGSRS